MKHLSFAHALVLGAAISLCGVSCVTIDTRLGQQLNPIEQMYTVYTAEIPLPEIQQKILDSLSAYSDRRLTIGSLREETFGLTSRSAAFTLVPMDDTLDFGANTQFLSLHLGLAPTEISTENENQESILQHFHVYALKDAGIELDTNTLYANSIKREMFAKLPEITSSPITYYHGDSLSISVTKKYGDKLMADILAKCVNNKFIIDTLPTFTKVFPGFFVCCDDPVGNGGRINMFSNVLQYDATSLDLTGNYGLLRFKADYGTRKGIDTTFVLLVGAPEIYQEYADVEEHYAFNICEHEGKVKEGAAAEKAMIEGGIGLKPVIPAEEIRSLILQDFEKNGIVDPSKVILNKVTLHLPYDCDDYDELEHFPETLCPTSRISGKYDYGRGYVSYANLADASLTDENQGDINRSLGEYCPDISFHSQQILNLSGDELKNIKNYDIWFTITKLEASTSSTTDEEYMELYNELAMMQYYNNLYYGGTNGYGSYGSYGYGGGYYNNYYSMAALYSSMYSTSSAEETEQLDKDRFYRASINGPKAKKAPWMTITYSVSKSNKTGEK